MADDTQDKKVPPRQVTQLGAAIKRARQALGWSQQDAADRSGVSKPTIARIESGTTEWLTPENLDALSQAFGQSPEDLNKGRVQLVDVEAAIAEYQASPYAQIDSPEQPELQWLRSLSPFVFAGHGKPTPQAVSALIAFHRLGKKKT